MRSIHLHLLSSDSSEAMLLLYKIASVTGSNTKTMASPLMGPLMSAMELSSHSTSLLIVTYTSILPFDISTFTRKCHLHLKTLWMSPTRHPQARTDPQVTLAFPTNLKRVKQILVARQVHHTSVGSQGDAMIATRPRPSRSFSEWLPTRIARRASDLRNGLSRRQFMTTRGESDPLDGADARGTIIQQLLRLYPPHTTKAISGPCTSRDCLEGLVMARPPSFDSSHRTTTRSSTGSDTPRGPWIITSVNRKPLPATARRHRLASDAPSSLASSNRNASQSSVAYGSNTPPPGPRDITSAIKPVPGEARKELVSFAPDTVPLRSTRPKNTNGTARWKLSRNTNVASWLIGRGRRIRGLYRYRRRPPTVYTSIETIRGEGQHLRAGTFRKKKIGCYEGT